MTPAASAHIRHIPPLNRSANWSPPSAPAGRWRLQGTASASFRPNAGLAWKHMNAAAQSAFWQQIDGAIVINLDQRTDRWTQFQQTANGLIPPDKLHRLSARWGRNIPGFGQR